MASNGNEVISLTQCQTALAALGYPTSIVTISMIKQILAYLDDVCRQESGNSTSYSTSSKTTNGYADDNISITFDNFCIIESYLSVLQQEILETSCVSPIKGTNLQQPPIYLTDFQGTYRFFIHFPVFCRINHDISYYYYD